MHIQKFSFEDEEEPANWYFTSQNLATVFVKKRLQSLPGDLLPSMGLCLKSVDPEKEEWHLEAYGMGETKRTVSKKGHFPTCCIRFD